jgi:hypothetical protein
MTTFTGTPFEHITNLSKVRLRLLICSLYLTAFEILKSAIVDGVADFYVDHDPESDHQHEEFVEFLVSMGVEPEEIEKFRVGVETFSSQVDRYEQEVAKDFGFRFTQRVHKGVIPSCIWLCEEGVLTEGDIEQIKHLRKQRNHIAHRLHDILVYDDLELDADSLFIMRELLRKVEAFWTRVYISIDHPEVYELPDENLFLPKLFVVDQIGRSVVEYINQIVLED